MENQDMKGFILAIIIIGLTLVIGIYVADTMTSNFRTPSISGSVVNETLTTVTETGKYTSTRTLIDVKCSIGICLNSTGNIVIPTANYTVSSACLVSYKGVNNANGFNHSNWKCSYT